MAMCLSRSSLTRTTLDLRMVASCDMRSLHPISFPRASHHCNVDVSSMIFRGRTRTASLMIVRVGSRASSRSIHSAAKAGAVLDGKRISLLSRPALPVGKESNPGFSSSPVAQVLHTAVVAFGSNLGDRLDMIERACRSMSLKGIKIKATSFLYETAPMYVTNQSAFLNGVCEVETQLEPHGLLNTLQSIENELGRQRIVDKGPRNIDLDIILFDDQTIEDDRLIVPHRLMLEREFVLRPLADLMPYRQLPSPQHHGTILDYLTPFDQNDVGDRPLAITPVAPNLPVIKAKASQRPTALMAIMNVTPDSFSDDGLCQSCDKEFRRVAKSFIFSGASIIDIGGQSTRPNAEKVSCAEELARVVPVITAVRALTHNAKVAISVDTFYSDVAKAAVEAGADIVNDVSAGTLDADMLHTVAKLGKTIILMHMRGDPSTMNNLTSYPGGVIGEVGRALYSRVEAALAAGIPRWRIILDPGIGFAKTQQQSLRLLRGLAELRQFPGLQGFPWLVGSSRKGFIGKITGVKEPSQRVWGTAAAVTASVQGGADVVRIHDVEAMRPVVQMADAIYRSEPENRGEPQR